MKDIKEISVKDWEFVIRNEKKLRKRLEEKKKLVMEIADEFIDFARDYEGMTTSDAQAVAEAKAHEIVNSISKLKGVV